MKCNLLITQDQAAAIGFPVRTHARVGEDDSSIEWCVIQYKDDVSYCNKRKKKGEVFTCNAKGNLRGCLQDLTYLSGTKLENTISLITGG